MISFEPFGRFTGHFEASGPHRYVDSVWRACEVSEKVEGTAVLESDLLSCKYTREPTCAVQNLSCWKSMSQKKRGTDNSCVQQHEQNTPL